MTRVLKLVVALTVAFAGFSVLLGAGQAEGAGDRSTTNSGEAWETVAPLPQSVFGGAAASDGTNLYVFGGYHFPAAQARR